MSAGELHSSHEVQMEKTQFRRPVAFGRGRRGEIFDGEAIAIYRSLNGISQQEVADRLRISRTVLVAYEMGARCKAVPEPQARKFLNAIDAIVRLRASVRAEGERRLAAYTPRVGS
jgi:DNA-binding transcriptional regulator YiaG